MTTHLTRGLVALAFMVLSVAGAGGADAANRTAAPKTVVLVGASIGEGWKIERLAERTGLEGYALRHVALYEFDKTPAIEALLRSAQKPDVVMIKECSTYFPGDLVEYRRKVAVWVRMLREAGVQPVLVTTAPLGAPEGAVERGKSGLKRLLGRDSAADGIAAFNDWMKAYAERERIPLFDLEAVLRRGAGERWMKPEYDSGDRVHLNAAGYRAMDRAFAQFLSGTPALRTER
ncbi:MAG TPA: SGNH/GDSL hydrolase family protein [Usitatibacter sp.]|nr:SGNH/GDSL hydrolase family protein [Usitatibacter sp.]